MFHSHKIAMLIQMISKSIKIDVSLTHCQRNRYFKNVPEIEIIL